MFNWKRHPSDDFLLRAIDGELSAGRLARLDRHLERCERCRRRFNDVDAWTDEMPRAFEAPDALHEASPALRARVLARVRELASQPSRSVFSTRERLACALSLLLVVASLFGPRPIRSRTNAVPWSEPGPRPANSITPGAATVPDMGVLCTQASIAKPSIPSSVRQAVLRSYGMEQAREDEYELDYLITPELGGIADVRNLWPERYETGVWNPHVKDQLELLLPELVCRQALDLAVAQHDIASDWIAAYQKYFHTDRPIVLAASACEEDDVDEAQGSADGAPRIARGNSEAPGFGFAQPSPRIATPQ